MPSSPPLTPLAAAVLHVGVPERILQVECDDGEGALFLAREFPSARVRGVDRSAERVHRAASRVGLDPEGRVAFKQGAPVSLPFPPNHFDLVAAIDALPSATETARVLRAGGYLAIANSTAPQPLPGLAGWLLRRRLRRLGFEQIWTDAAGDGSFSVERLRGSGPAGRSL